LLGLITVRNNGFFASDRNLTSTTGKINMHHYLVFGMYQPSAITPFTVAGQSNYISANDRDSRDFPGYSEDIRVGAGRYLLDPAVFPNACLRRE